MFYAYIVLNVNTFWTGVCSIYCTYYEQYSMAYTINYSVFQILLVYWNVYKIAYRRRPVVSFTIAATNTPMV